MIEQEKTNKSLSGDALSLIHQIDMVLLENKFMHRRKMYQRILDDVQKSNYSDEIIVNTLTEVYILARLNDIPTSIDPRGDQTFKFQCLYEIATAFENNTFDENTLKGIKQQIKICLYYLEHPLELHHKYVKWEQEHPGAKF